MLRLETSINLKLTILIWLKKRALIPNYISIDQMFSIYKNGALFQKILNYFTKKQNEVFFHEKGTNTVYSTYESIFDFLVKKDNFQSRYSKMDINRIIYQENHFWGLLHDLYVHFENDQANDSRQIKVQTPKINITKQESVVHHVENECKTPNFLISINLVKNIHKNYPISSSFFPFKKTVNNIKPSNELLRLRDGILLCKLLGNLEQKEVCFEKEPKTKAACLMNLKKVFNILREKKGFNKLLLEEINEEVFFEGKKENVERILTALKKCYKIKHLLVQLNEKEKKEIVFYENYMQKYVLNKNERDKMLILPMKIDQTCF